MNTRKKLFEKKKNQKKKVTKNWKRRLLRAWFLRNIHQGLPRTDRTLRYENEQAARSELRGNESEEAESEEGTARGCEVGMSFIRSQGQAHILDLLAYFKHQINIENNMTFKWERFRKEILTRERGGGSSWNLRTIFFFFFWSRVNVPRKQRKCPHYFWFRRHPYRIKYGQSFRILEKRKRKRYTRGRGWGPWP